MRVFLTPPPVGYWVSSGWCSGTLPGTERSCPGRSRDPKPTPVLCRGSHPIAQEPGPFCTAVMGGEHLHRDLKQKTDFLGSGFPFFPPEKQVGAPGLFNSTTLADIPPSHLYLVLERSSTHLQISVTAHHPYHTRVSLKPGTSDPFLGAVDPTSQQPFSIPGEAHTGRQWLSSSLCWNSPPSPMDR